MSKQKINLYLSEKIESERLILKKHTLDKKYIQKMVDLINQNRQWLGKFLSHFEEPMTFEKEEVFLKMLLTQENEINYAIYNKKTNELMGTIGAFNPDNKDNPKSIEVGIMLFEKFAGQHYGPEAIDTMEKTLFQQGIDTVILKIQKENARSRKVAENQGYTWDGKTGPSRSHPNLQMLIYKKQKGKKI